MLLMRSFIILILISLTIYPQTQTTLKDLGTLSSKTSTAPGVFNCSASYQRYLYVAGLGNIYIYKATDPQNPTHIKTIPIYSETGGARRVWVGENYLFVYTGYRIKIYDLANPESPLLKSDYFSGEDLHKVSAKGNYMFVLYMTDQKYGKAGSLEIVDISNPSSVQLKGSYKPSNYEGRSFSFSATENRIFVAHYENLSKKGYIREIDYSDPSKPLQVRELIVDGAPIEISVSGNTLFMLKDGGWTGPSKLEAYNLATSSISVLSSLQVSTERAWDMHVYGNSITTTLLENNGIKDYTWNETSKSFEAGQLLNIPLASQMSWFVVSTQTSNSISNLKKTAGGYWVYIYYYVVEKSPSSLESEVYGNTMRLIEKAVWIEEIDVKVTLITSIFPAEASADGCTVTPAGSNQFDKNSNATLDASAGAGWVWDKWSGSLSGSVKPQQLKMDDNKNVIGNFQPILTLSLSSQADNYLCSPGQNEELTIATANIFVDGVNWQLTGISFTAIHKFKPDYTEVWIEYAGTKLKGAISTDANGYVTSISFSPSKQIDEGNTLAVRLFYKFNYPSKSTDKYIPAALDEVKKYKISIHVGQVDCVPIPTSCQPGVKTPKYPPNVFTSNTQTVASVWNVTKNPNIPFATIKEAVESPLTVDHDLIRVCPGWYIEKVIIDKSITVFSTDGAKSTIVEAAKIDDVSKRDNLFTLKKSGIVISGFSIINGGKGVILNNGLVKVNNCELKNNIFTGNSNSSIEVENGDYNNIHDNTAENPVYIMDGNNNTIEKNTIGLFDDKGKDQSGIAIWNSSQKNIIKDNVIGGNLDAGISLSGVDVKQTEIKSNKIGTNAEGTKAKPNKQGIYLRDCGQAYIEDNLISGNIESGILLSNYSSANNIKNNIIGSNLLKTDKLPNLTGIKLEYENEGNLIEGNLISGNLMTGIDLVRLCTNNQIINNMIGSSAEENTNLVNGIGVNIRSDSRNNLIENNVFACNVTSLLIIGDGADGNKVINNKFGTNIAGTKILPSISGILLFGGKNNLVSNNLIAGHTVGGIAIMGDDTRSNTISANKIGVDITGTKSLKNTMGLFLAKGAKNNLVAENLVSGNMIAISITNEETTNNIVEKNKIGVDITGTKALPNEIGIALFKGATGNILRNNLISGNSTFVPNPTVDDKKYYGIYIFDNGTSYNTIEDNILGLDINLSNKLPNDIGIGVGDGANRNIFRWNTIGGNTFWGIMFDSYASYNTVWRNYFGTNSSGTIRFPNKMGVVLRNSNFNTIANNKVWYNETGIYEENGENYISNNDINENTGNTGIHLVKSFSEIIGNIITKDGTDAIKCESGSNPTIRLNNIYDNKGFGLVNTDPAVKINATNNWWGTASGPINKTNGNVSAGNWLSSESKLTVLAARDTLYISENGTDSMSVYCNNWANNSDKINITISSDKESWITSSKSFTVDLSKTNSGESKIKFELPAGISNGNNSRVIISGASQSDVSLTSRDTLHVAAYKQRLNFLRITPDTVSCMPADTLVFRESGYDQYKNSIPSIVTWSANGGKIDQNGKFIAGDKFGRYRISATGMNGSVIAEAYVKIGTGELTSIGEEKKVEELPTEYSLSQNYPNPFNPTTTIRFALPKSEYVSLKVYDILGREVAVLVNEEKTAGNYEVRFNGSKLSSGVYFYQLRAGNFVQTKKFLLLK